MANGIPKNQPQVLTKEKIDVSLIGMMVIAVGAASILLGTSMAALGVISTPTFKIAGKPVKPPTTVKLENYSVTFESPTCYTEQFVFLPSSEVENKYKMASDLTKYISGLDVVSKLNDQGGYDDYIVGVAVSDFPLEVGVGYKLGIKRCMDSMLLSLPGFQQGSSPLNLLNVDEGNTTQNEFMLPQSWEGTDIEELCNSIENYYVSRIVAYENKPKSRKVKTYDCGTNVGNFNLSTNKAVIAYMKHSKPWPFSPGTLTAQLAQLPVAQTVVSGTQDHVFANIVLDASQSAEDIRVSQVQVAIHPTGASANELSNFRIFDGDTQLQVNNDPDSGLSSIVGQPSTSTSTFVSSLIVYKGTSRTLQVKANISKLTSNGDVFNIGLQAKGPITATGAGSGYPVKVSYTFGDGQPQTITQSGKLTLAKSSSGPKSGLLPGNIDGLTIAIMNATAQYEDINIRKIYLTAEQVNSGGWDQIDRLHIYDGSTYITSVTPTATDAAERTVLIDVTNNPLNVPKDSSKDFTFKVDTSNVNGFLGSKGEAGQGLKLKITSANDVTAIGVASSASIAPSYIPTFNSFTLYKSVPTIATNDDLGSEAVPSGTLPNGTTGSMNLYKFKVTADSAGDIALYQITQLITTYNATVTMIHLYDGTQTVAASPVFNITEERRQHEMIFTNDGRIPSMDRTNVLPYTVSAGTSDTFTLRGDVECSYGCMGSSGSGGVMIQLLGDGNPPYHYPDRATSLGNVNEIDLIWSDLWLTLNTANPDTINSSQWTNGYLIPKAGGGTLQPTSTAVSFTR